jgi:hypothetical protein
MSPEKISKKIIEKDREKTWNKKTRCRSVLFRSVNTKMSVGTPYVIIGF